MKQINLKDFYKSLYDHDQFYDVPDEVAELLITLRRGEEAARRLMYKYKAYYSLDREDGIEHSTVVIVPSAEDVVIRHEELSELYGALNSLTDKQLWRMYAHFFLKLNYTQIARLEKINESSVRRSISSAVLQLEKIKKIFSE